MELPFSNSLFPFPFLKFSGCRSRVLRGEAYSARTGTLRCQLPLLEQTGTHSIVHHTCCFLQLPMFRSFSAHAVYLFIVSISSTCDTEISDSGVLVQLSDNETPPLTGRVRIEIFLRPPSAVAVSHPYTLAAFQALKFQYELAKEEQRLLEYEMHRFESALCRHFVSVANIVMRFYLSPWPDSIGESTICAVQK